GRGNRDGEIGAHWPKNCRHFIQYRHSGFLPSCGRCGARRSRHGYERRCGARGFQQWRDRRDSEAAAHFKLNGLKVVVMTGKPDSTLGKAGDAVIDVGVNEEACPLGLAPTASTTASLAMGDALAVVLLEKKGFKEEDFAVRHPGGILGRKLLLRV